MTETNDDMVSLTELWRAAGGDPNKRPADWARKEGATFIEFIGNKLNTPTGHIIEAEREHDGGTWAHWQIGMAYAEYLSPGFHVRCNEIVHADKLTNDAGNPLADQFLDALRRTGNE